MRTKAGKPYTAPASKYEQPWINAVRDAARNTMRHAEPEVPPYIVDLTFQLARPVKPAQEWPTASDLDKLVRAVLDGLVLGGAMTDDRHVIELTARKEYTDDPAFTGVVAQVSTLTVAITV